MTVNYTTNLALGQPVTGTESGTWGDDVNNAVTSYLDIAIAGGLSVTVTTADVTLTITQGTSVATNIGSTTAQYAILNVSGAMTAARNLIVPSSSRIYLINNNTTGGFALTVKGSATSGVTLVNGEKAHVFWNGTDYAKLSNASGGAGVFSSITNSGLTSGRVVYSTTGGLETDSANLTFNGTTLTANTIGAFTLSGTIAGGGNQINNVIIGTTTPLAGAFTTLAASGAVTLSGGTANGVTYLNGSKVLTSGTALTFNGSALAVNSLTPGVGINDTTATVGVSYSWLNGGASYAYGQIALRDTTLGQTAYSYVSGASGYHNWFQTGSEQMRLTSTGLGIGTSSPANKLSVLRTGSGDAITWASSTGKTAYAYADGSGIGLFTGASVTGTGFYANDTSSYFATYTGGSERARIDSSGNLLVGTTSASIGNTSGSRFVDAGRTLNITNTTATNPSIITNQVGFGGATVSFRYTNSEIGYISTSSTIVAYVTASDYRLKNTVAPMTGALAKVALLKPCTYKWNEDGSDGEGFIAHELQAVFPNAVSGEKDAVNEDGSIKPQGIDTSFLVATLTAAIQEQQTLITQLTARITALETA